jgi:aryl-alcohol dehydrogenase-like predicted oxidoreductase
MKYTLLGRSGLRVSELCLGTMTFGEEGSSKSDNKKVFDQFVRAGGNFFDTANVYTEGRSESLLGEFARSAREQMVIATKYRLNTTASDPNASGCGRKNLMQAVHASLRRLNTEYIDLLWVHAWDKLTPIEEMMRGLDDLVRQGKVLYVGASNLPAWVVSEANMLAKLKGLTPFVALQLEYSLIERTIEREYFDMASMCDLTICPWSPLAGGVLTGKYNKKTMRKARYSEDGLWTARYVNERNCRIAEVVVNMAQAIGKTPAQVALNWVRQKYNRIIPIVGATRVEQLNDNLGCFEFRLTDDEMRVLDQASPLDRGFPYEFLAFPGMEKLLYGNSRVCTNRISL